MSWSLHRPVESFVTKIECSGDVLTYDARHARATQGTACVQTARGEACGVAMGRGHLVLRSRELRLESYCSCEHEERGAGWAVRKRGAETQRA